VDWLRWENGTITEKLHITTGNGLVNNRVHHAARGNDTTVWFAHRTPFESEDSGVSRLSWIPGDISSVSVAVITGSVGLPSPQVSFVLPMGGRYAWAATDGGLAYIDADRLMVLETYGTQDGLPSALVTSLALHRDGTIYVGTASGLAGVSGGTVSPVEGLDLAVESVVCDNLGTVWVSTSDGLKRYYPSTGAIEQYTPFNSPLLPGTISAMLVENDNGHLWMATGHGMWMGELETGLTGDGSAAGIYPDPFLPGRGDVLGISGVPDEPAEISIFDLTGNLVFEYSSTGRDDFAWNGTTAGGSPAASGVYMMTVRSGAYDTLLMKFALVR
jgi:ligand-binding sensor domain-containing protein